MALNDARKNTKTTAEEKAEKIFGGETAGADTTAQAGVNTGVDFGLDLMGGLFMAAEDGSEYTNKFAEAARSKLDREMTVAGLKIENRIIKLDNSQFMDLPYSYVVFATKSDKAETVYYHVACLEATGRKPVPVNQVVEDIKMRQNNLIYVPADTFDPVLKARVDQVLQASFGIDPSKFVTSEGHVVPFDQDPEHIGKISAIIAYNANIARLGLDQGIVNYISLPKFIQADRNSMFQLDITHNTGVTIGALGRPVRSDFELDLYKVAVNKGNGIMPRESRLGLTTAVGYVEYLPEERPGQFGQAPQKDIIPMIILDQFHGRRPTVEMSLLSIINSATFSSAQNLFGLLMRVPRDLGNLNVIANLDGDKSGFGKPFKFKSGKLSDEQILQIMQRMFRTQPIVAVEVEFYGADFGVNAPFAALGVPGVRDTANEEIVKVAEALLGTQIANRQVAYGEPIVVPVGEWIDKNGNKRDVREIDLAYVIENSNDINLVMKWIASNAPASVTGIDPYIAKLEVINALIPNAVITGKAVRVTLNPAFVAEIVEKAMAAGYNPRTDIGAVQFSTFNNLQAIAAAYGGATLGGVQFGAYAQQQQAYVPQAHMFGWR